MPDKNLSEEFKSVFHKAYGRQLTDAEVEEIIRNADKVLAEARGKAAVKTGGDLSVAEEEVIFNEEYWNWDEVYEIVKKSKFYKKKYSLTKDETLALFALRDKGNGAAWKTLIHFNYDRSSEAYINNSI